MYKVYILQSLKDKKTYTGYTKDIKVRIQEHNLGRVKATRNRRPFRILYIENVSGEGGAKKREKYWKSGGGRRKLQRYFRYGFPPIFDERGSRFKKARLASK